MGSFKVREEGQSPQPLCAEGRILPSVDSNGQTTDPWAFRMDWLDLLAVQGTPKSLLQHHSSQASILRCSVFFTVQLSHPYMTTGKTIVWTGPAFSQEREEGQRKEEGQSGDPPEDRQGVMLGHKGTEEALCPFRATGSCL